MSRFAEEEQCTDAKGDKGGILGANSDISLESWTSAVQCQSEKLLARWWLWGSVVQDRRQPKCQAQPALSIAAMPPGELLTMLVLEVAAAGPVALQCHRCCRRLLQHQDALGSLVQRIGVKIAMQ